MDPFLRALMQSWDWRIDVLTVLMLLGTLYTLGWRALRKTQRGKQRLASGWRFAAY